MNQEVWWVQSHMTVWVIIFDKVQEWHAYITELQSHLDCFVFELSKDFEDIIYLMNSSK